jgi:ribosome biogenesis protein ERB1
MKGKKKSSSSSSSSKSKAAAASSTSSSKPQPPPLPSKAEEEEAPDVEPVDDDDDHDDDSSGSDDYDDDDDDDDHDDDDDSDNSSNDPQVSDDYDDDDDDDESEDEFEEQGSSSSDDDDDDALNEHDDDSEEEEDDEEVEILNDADLMKDIDAHPRSWPANTTKKEKVMLKRGGDGKSKQLLLESSTTAATTSNRTSNAGVDDNTITNNNPSANDELATAQWMHADNLSSDDDDDDEDRSGNRIGRIPLHWYDEFDHIGYNVHGKKVIKSTSSSNAKDLLDRALDANDQLLLNDDDDDANNNNNKFTVYDALNAKDVTLTPRQITLLRRLQSGAFAHPEFNAHPDSIPYYSGVDPMISGLNSNRYLPKSNFQPSKYEKLQVRRLLHRLKCGSISMDFLEGKVRDMNDLVTRPDGSKVGGEDGGDKPFPLWKGDEEDELALRKGPQHMPAPKVPPPGHAYSYNPPLEYLPNETELSEWKEMDPTDRPYGLYIPTKFDNLRSVGAYPHSVQERFERCLDLYLCPRSMKRRLNIDPESLVPQLPKASDLRPYPTTKAVRYVDPTTTTQKEDGAEVVVVPVRCLSVSPDGQFLVSGCENGIVRLWEVQTGRLLRKWDLSMLGGDGGDAGGDDGDDDAAKTTTTARMPIASLEWNPNRTHHVLLAAVGKCAVLISTGTGGMEDSEITDALLSAARDRTTSGNNSNIAPESRAAKAVTWSSTAIIPKDKMSKKSTDATSSSSSTPVSAFGIGKSGPVAILRTNSDVASVKWHRKGDYFGTLHAYSYACNIGFRFILLHSHYYACPLNAIKSHCLAQGRCRGGTHSSTIQGSIATTIWQVEGWRGTAGMFPSSQTFPLRGHEGAYSCVSSREANDGKAPTIGMSSHLLARCTHVGGSYNCW